MTGSPGDVLWCTLCSGDLNVHFKIKIIKRRCGRCMSLQNQAGIHTAKIQVGDVLSFFPMLNLLNIRES